MPIVLRSEKARTTTKKKTVTLLFLVAGDSSYSNHKFSARVFNLQSTVLFWNPTRNNLC